VTIMPGRETRNVDAPTVGAMLKQLGLHQDAYLVVRGDDILTHDARVRDDEEVDLIPVISGGRR
jgi:sulfur carrier protein